MKTRYFLVTAFLACIVGCGGGFRANMPPPDSYRSSLPESETPISDESVKFDVPVHVNKEVKNYLVYFSTDRKKVMQRWLSRAPQYLPMIKGIFQEYGLPEDLAYLAMIESGFNPNARSSAGAVGMWQFIKGTGRRYGLVIDNHVDERLNPEKSTRAAAKYLLDLYKRFGSWYLAAASYNCGEMRVQRELGKSNNRNFWELSANKCLPNETKNYVPQMIAATIIAKNPQKFGFTHLPGQPDLPRDYREEMEPASELAQAGGAGVAPRSQPRSIHPGTTTIRVEEQAPAPAASAPKPRTEAKVYAKKSAKKQSHQVHEAESEGSPSPYRASVLGSGHDQQPAKGINGKKTRKQQLSAADKKKKTTQVKAPTGKKPKAPHLAKKNETKTEKKHETKTAKASNGKKKNSASNSKEKLAKPKAKPIVVSEAR
ncbi:MAG: lytic transglycosylase domain-containing protein [Desulfobaccales bacterium]